MKINYMRDPDRLCTEIFVDYPNNAVKIINHTDVILDRAFGVNENPTIEDFEYFIEDRCFPRTRDHLDITLKLHGIDSGYNPLVIAKKLNGRVAGDDHYLVFEDEGSL